MISKSPVQICMTQCEMYALLEVFTFTFFVLQICFYNMFRETFSLNSADFVMKCPGHYCGRIELGSNNYSDCGACPRGYRAELSICKYCDDKPELYDWLYLGFMSLLPLVLHWFCIDNVSPLVVKWVASILINEIYGIF